MRRLPLGVSRAHGTPQPIEKCAVRFVVHIVAPTFGWVMGHKVSQYLGDGGGVVVCNDGGVGGHDALRSE